MRALLLCLRKYMWSAANNLDGGDDLSGVARGVLGGVEEQPEHGAGGPGPADGSWLEQGGVAGPAYLGHGRGQRLLELRQQLLHAGRRPRGLALGGGEPPLRLVEPPRAARIGQQAVQA